MAKSVSRPIGIFDSGVGGLTVLQAIWHELPDETCIYLADQAHVPYGPRPLEQVRSFAEGITRFLLENGAKLIVVACNAASAAALHHLRKTFPDTPFVGMEPAVKPAVENSHSGVVGVLATPATFQGELYASVVERFAAGVRLVQHTCPGLVAQIEAGQFNSAGTRSILEHAIRPMLLNGIDTIVLGCTHYPLVISLIREIAGPEVRVIDPAPAVARQVRRLLEHSDSLAVSMQDMVFSESPKGETSCQADSRSTFITTADTESLRFLLRLILNLDRQVRLASWNEDLKRLSIIQ